MLRNAPYRALATLVALSLALTASAALAVPKTDVITLLNGNTITCEIKEMSYGKLKVKTNDMGTLSIKWNKIANLKSQYWFLVTRSNGDLHYGQIKESDSPLTLVVTYMKNDVAIPLYDIVAIEPVRYNLWDKFYISAAMGYNWTQANDSQMFNLDFTTDYSGRVYSWGLNASSILSDNEGSDLYRRFDSNLFLSRQTTGDFFGKINTSAQRNDELGLRLRLSASLSYGYKLVQTNRNELKVSLGLSANREYGTQDDDPTENSGEVPISADYKLFKYDSLKSDIVVSASYIPNLTINGRYRYEIDIAASQEVISDLYVELSYYISYDSNPPAGANSNNDQGLIFSIGWTKY